MRRDTYERALRRPEDDLSDLQSLLVAALSVTQTFGDPGDLADALREVGADEERLWDLLYHHTVSLEQVLSEIAEDRRTQLLDEYGAYVRGASELLSHGDAHGRLDVIEKVARDGLAFLSTASEDRVGAEHLSTLHEWFPTLTPRIVEYVSTRTSDWVPDYLVAALSRLGPEQEWEAAWLASAARAGQPSEPLVQLLERLVEAEDTPGLLRAEALRSLSALGEVDQARWERALERLSNPLRAELRLVEAAKQVGGADPPPLEPPSSA